MIKCDRIIQLNDSVEETSVLNAIVQLLDYNNEDKTKPIYLYINSPGGSIIDGLALYDAMKYIEAPVYTVCIGLAASMGAFLLSCGEKGHRAALKHSRILIHQPLIDRQDAPTGKKESDLRKTYESIKKDRDVLEAIMAENTGQPLEKLHKDCDRDNWMTSEEALAYGLIDEII